MSGAARKGHGEAFRLFVGALCTSNIYGHIRTVVGTLMMMMMMMMMMMIACFLEFYILGTSKAISGVVPTCNGAHSW